MEDEDCNDDEQVLDCPACNESYSDADADFLICSRCGWNENKKRYDNRCIERGWSGYGIDPDVTHRINMTQL